MDARNSAAAAPARSAVVGFDADTGVHREAAVFVAQHVFGVTVLQQAPSNEGAQDAFLQCGLHWGHGSRIDAGGRVKDDTGDEIRGVASASPSPSTSSNTPSTHKRGSGRVH